MREVHLAFLRAGADCITSATYQATLPALRERGLDQEAARALLADGVRLATRARDDFWSVVENRRDRLRPLVAASVGPYGASLADGSEYTGQYGLTRLDLYDFHRERWRVLAQAGADLVACETIPSCEEVAVLMRLLRETPGVWTWVSFSCSGPGKLADGSSLAAAVRACESEQRVAAMGVNCVAPEMATALVKQIAALTSKPVMAYPNSGERWDSRRKGWIGRPALPDLGASARDWARAGARVVGGCCRIGPAGVAAIRGALEPSWPVARRRGS